MDTRKYIFENGMMRLNPNFKGNQNQAPSTVSSNALAIVSSTDDIMQASQAQLQATGQGMQLSQATTFSMDIMQDQDYINKFQSNQKIDGGQILDGISNIFARYEVPIGLVNKLLALTEYKLNFIVDDSGSMSNDSDAPLSFASPFMKQKFRNQNRPLSGVMTRWEEAEDRIHVMIDMLAYVPTEGIRISFLNRNDQLFLDHRGKTPEQFAQYAHDLVGKSFIKGPSGQTPIYKHLSAAFMQSSGSTMHYLFTDGSPTDCNIQKLKDLVLHRANPKMNPLTFMSCTNDDDEAEWMKEIEEDAPFTAELDDYASEKKEVEHDQGQGLPFSRGFWLLCQLVAAINPDDLDALDESLPFTKMTIDNLMGRKTTPEEYQYYFKNNPNAQKYSHLYQQFMREDITARQIVPKQGQTYQSSVGQSQYGSSNTMFNNTPSNQGMYNQPQSSYQSQQTQTQSNAYTTANQMPSTNPGSYPNNQQQGAYPNNPQQGGYPNNQQQGSYPNNQQQGGVSSQGYNPGMWNNQPNQRTQNQYNNAPQNQYNNQPMPTNRPGFGR